MRLQTMVNHIQPFLPQTEDKKEKTLFNQQTKKKTSTYRIASNLSSIKQTCRRDYFPFKLRWEKTHQR
jgi:hypothetical protein